VLIGVDPWLHFLPADLHGCLDLAISDTAREMSAGLRFHHAVGTATRNQLPAALLKFPIAQIVACS